MKRRLNAVDVSKYILRYLNDNDMGINNLQLQKVLYVLQYEFIKRYDDPLFPDEITAWAFGPCIVTVYYHYCYYAGQNIWVLPRDKVKEPDFSTNYDPEEQELIQSIAVKYRKHGVPENDDGTYEQLFGKDGLWKRTYEGYMADVERQKEIDPDYTPDRFYNPPITLDDIKRDILNTGLYPNVTPEERVTQDVTIQTAPLVRQFIDTLASCNFDYELMGISTWHTVFEWTRNVKKNHVIHVQVQSREKNEPLKVRISLVFGGKDVYVLTPNWLTGRYVLTNQNLTVKLTIK